MSDPMMGGAMPPRPPQGGGIASKMSMFNPTDVAAKAAMGDIRPDMTVGEFLQKNFGVSPDDPVQKLIEATRQQVQNRSMAGKMGVQQGQGAIPRPTAAAPPPPSGGMAGGQPSRGLDDLVNKLG